MFFHIYKYRLKTMLHQKEEFFWALIFPLILGTCFFAAFSNITKTTEGFNTIPVAVVLEQVEEEAYFTELMDSLAVAEEGKVPFLEVYYTTPAEAQRMLSEEEVAGMVVVKDGTPSLTVLDNGIYQTMLKTVLDKYMQTMDMIQKIIPQRADKLEDVIAAVTREAEYIREQKLTEGNMDMVIDYFFALIAMTCLMGTTAGQTCAMDIKANLSAIGLRKSVSSTKRITLILGDLFASYTMSILANALLIFYLMFILKLNFGSSFWEIYPVSLAGSLIAVSIGMLVGFIPKIGEGAKIGINISFTLFSSFLSGLMMGGIKHLIEAFCPIINRINPASLISDALHSLNIYDSYEKYTQCMVIMIIMSVLLLTASIVIARREVYDSI